MEKKELCAIWGFGNMSEKMQPEVGEGLLGRRLQKLSKRTRTSTRVQQQQQNQQ